MSFLIKNGCLIKYIEDDGKDNVIIPHSITYIADNAFCDCIGLKEIVLPNSLKSIGYTALKGCILFYLSEKPKLLKNLL